ncbi:hypothetical protein ACJJTC_017523 [Scirpophaga incertulas]
MSNINNPSLRIDWFDGTLMENSRPHTGTSSSDFVETPVESPAPLKPQYTEKKPIGFKRLLDISMLKNSILILEISHRPGFWMLLDADLKGDFIVLIVKILSNIYSSLEPDENSKIGNMLRDKFQKSIFLTTLKQYLTNLPNVRIVEKRLNSQLWDDAETFYYHVISLFEGIIKFNPNDLNIITFISDMIETLELSVIGVKENHSERFGDDLFSKIQELKTNILNNATQTQYNIKSNKDIEVDIEPDSFRNLSVFPSKEDLIGNQQILLQPNIINGAYQSVERYLDLQFKLLREDCFGPLREGICTYMNNPTKRRHENIRIYPKVRIIRTYVSNNRVGHLIDIAWRERLSEGMIDNRKYAYNKQLMYGSLLLFTNNNFQDIICATVLDSNLSLLTEGYVAVSFQNPVSTNIFATPYLMVESEVFFEPYHQVLRVLKTFKENDMPLKKYIVDIQENTPPPSYLSSDTVYSIINKINSKELHFPVLDTENWPQANYFGLDDSQMEAYKFALTKEFSVIQGPPGTGKTFIGIKIASTLLRNLSLEGTPMLIICYTNHALDQFLEGILGVTKNVVRLGSQSKSKILESYTLHNLRSKIKCKYSHIYGSKRAELETMYKEMTNLQTEIEKCEKEIVQYNNLKPYLIKHDQVCELMSSNEDPVLDWLFNDKSNNDYVRDELDDWEKQFDDITINEGKIETCFSKNWALKEIESLSKSIIYVKDISKDDEERQKLTDKLEGKICTLKKRLEIFKKYHYCEKDENIDTAIRNEVQDLYNLTMENRWKLYKKCVGTLKNELIAKMNILLDKHNKCNKELEEVASLIDSEVMKTVRVVGVTTTMAARRHDLMRRLLSPIVIVEEAAEVLEAHIVASLTHHCDHKQLRPTAAHYKLAKHYNLEISLFERMLRNGVHARTLTTQRRMRPNFVELLVPTIYEKLDSHPTVYDYANVRGIVSNLYFCTHNVWEDSEGLEESWSHKNTWEAKWCVALACYLRQQKYGSDAITILATYTGQVTLIKELSRRHESMRDIKITAVDNYQGEENKIVILSLVRSNKDGKIGFLAAPNRICVALSRAKEGSYLFLQLQLFKCSMCNPA